MPANTLEDLHQQIAQRERELKALRQELESRRDRVTTLMRRKEELQNQLQQVEGEISALSAGASASAEQRKAAAPPAPQPKAASQEARPKLGDLILVMLRESGKPMTARQLSEEAQRRGIPLAANAPIKSIEARVQEMKKKGTVLRAAGQPGYILATSTRTAKTAKPKTSQPAPSEPSPAAAKSAKPQATAKLTPSQTAAKPAQPPKQGKQPSLRQVLLNVLKNSRKPLSGTELAERVKAAGYKSTSAKFVEIVWSTLGQMDEVQHLAGKGYQLKRKG